MAVLQIASNVAAVGIDPKYNKFFGNYVRSCMRRTVAYFDLNGKTLDIGSDLIVCPIRLYDRIINITTDSRTGNYPTSDTASGDAVADYNLALYSKIGNSVEKIVDLGAAKTAATTAFLKLNDTVAVYSEFDFRRLSIAGYLQKAGTFNTLLNSAHKDDSEFYLGFRSSTAQETGSVTYFTVIVDTVDGTPSAQDNARAENIYGSVIVNSAS